LVEAEFRARTEEQLAAATVELEHSRAPLLGEALPALAIDWACALTAAALPEAYPYPRVYAALSALLDAIEHAPSARGWAIALARFEQLLLAELGYAGPEGQGEADLAAQLRTSGRAIAEHLLTGRRADVLAARERLLDRLGRALA
jgi:DNA repair protein RecO (recombination protein O)